MSRSTPEVVCKVKTKAFNKLVTGSVERGEDFDKIPSAHRSSLNATSSAAVEAIDQNKMMIDELIGTANEIESRTVQVMDAMQVAFELKAESLIKLRSWRKSIEIEMKLAESAAKGIDQLLSTDRIDALSIVVDLMQKLGEANNNEILNKILK